MALTSSSDHAPVVLIAAPRRPRPPRARPVAKEVFASPLFERFAACYDGALNWDLMPVTERWRVHTLMLQECARRARDALFAEARPAPEVERMVLHACARAVCRNDGATARRLVDGSPLAARTLAFCRGNVVLREPAAFKERLGGARRAQLEAALAWAADVAFLELLSFGLKGWPPALLAKVLVALPCHRPDLALLRQRGVRLLRLTAPRRLRR